METCNIGKQTKEFDFQLENTAIQDYDSELNVLKNQVEFYKNEHESLRSELTGLIDENHSLSEQLRMALASNTARDNLTSGTGSHIKEEGMVVNIKQQFALIVQEKDAAVEMWQSALKEINVLEEELKNYQEYMNKSLTHTHLDKVKEQYSEAITLLEAKLTWTKSELGKERSLRENFARELEKLKLDYETSCKLIDAQKDQFQEALKIQAEAEERIRDLEVKLHSALEENSSLSNSRHELETALTRCHDSISALKGKYEEACNKVEEAVSLLEAACIERDRAVQAETAARDEIMKSQAALSRLIDDAGTKVKEEVELIKNRYNQQIEKVLFDMKKLEEKLADKSLQLEKVMRDYSATQDELDRVSRLEVVSSQPGTAMLEKKLQNLFLELSELHHHNFQLTRENDNLILQLNNIKNRYEQDLEKSEEECRLLEQRLLEATVLYEEAAAQVQQLSGQLELLQHDVELSQKKNTRELQSVIERLEQQELDKYIQERDELISRLQAVQVKSVETANELHHHLESQQEIKNKWKKTVKTVTQEFEARLKELRNETTSLRGDNQRLKEELKTLHAEMTVYQQIGKV